MPDAVVVAEYLDMLTRELAFDMRLSRRARKEIEDHLLEATAERHEADWLDAQRSAVARFGDPREIARQYAGSALFARTRRLGFIALAALIGMQISMRGRGAWYGLMQWHLSDYFRDTVAAWMPFLTIALRVALAIAIVGLVQIALRGAPAVFHAHYRRQVRRSALLYAAIAATLSLLAGMDIVLTSLRISETNLSASDVVPASLLAMEIALVSLLAIDTGAIMRRTAQASSLLTR
jgi:hypothetical protein